MKLPAITIAILLAIAAHAQTATDLLRLSGSQLVQIEQLYDYIHAIRYREETANKPPKESPIRTAFEHAQREAKSLLSPGQLYLLEQRADQVKQADPLTVRLLLTGTYEDFMALPVDIDAAKRWQRSRDAYKRDNRRWGFGFCGHFHWCGKTKFKCGNEFITPRARTPIPMGGSTGSRGGTTGKRG